MSLRSIHSSSAHTLTVADSGDVLVWSGDDFSGVPNKIEGVNVKQISDLHQGRSVTASQQFLQDAWGAKAMSILSPDDMRFVREVLWLQNDMPRSARDRWVVYGIRTSTRLRSIRYAMRLCAFVHDHDAWIRIKKAADETEAVVEIDNVSTPQLCAPAMQAVELWWESSIVAEEPPDYPAILDPLWEEFNLDQYARRST